MRTHKNHAGRKLARKRKRTLNEQRRAEEKERANRDARVTARYGEKAHKMCGRKKRYETKSAALSRASRCTLRGSVPLAAYRCPYCQGWHLTSKM